MDSDVKGEKKCTKGKKVKRRWWRRERIREKRKEATSGKMRVRSAREESKGTKGGHR